MDPSTLNPVDLRLFEAWHGTVANTPFMWVMVAFTLIGTGWSAFALVPLYAIKRARPFARWLAGTWCVAAILVYGLKALVRRPRPCTVGAPPLWGTPPTDFSCPSGHAAGSFTLAAFVAVVLLSSPQTRRQPWRWLCAGTLVLFAGCIALSRVYIGVHWPTDVMAGATLGSLVGAAGARLYTRSRPR